MDVSEALEIIHTLADGVDPNTGELFPEDSPYQHPRVIRALFAATQALTRIEKKQTRDRRLPENAGRSWNSEEDEQLCNSLDAGLTLIQLAEQHGRTRGAIAARLEKLGKVPPHSFVRKPTLGAS